jgi:hypothetical protein
VDKFSNLNTSAVQILSLFYLLLVPGPIYARKKSKISLMGKIGAYQPWIQSHYQRIFKWR